MAVIVLSAAIAFLVVSHFFIGVNKTRVAVVGDSLTAQATWSIIDELNNHGYNSTVAGVNGATVADEARQLESLTLPGGSDIVVVALGTNNAFFASMTDSRHIDPDSSKRDIHDAMTRVFEGQPGQQWQPSTRCLVWVNVSDQSPLLALDKNGPILNHMIDDEAGGFRAKGRRVVVADWAGASRAQPDWFLADRVHLTPEGERAYANVIRTAVDRCF